MNRIQGLQQYFSSSYVEVPVLGFIANLILAALLAAVLSRVYVRYGHSLSNRHVFSKNFVLITMTTMFIITVVKASLALSLGLVGALSIVRFRAAIKEPEELAYLFVAISVGLGLGASQTVITLVAFLVIVGIVIVKEHRFNSQERENLCVTISSDGPRRVELEQIVNALKEGSRDVKLKRVDEGESGLEASFIVSFDDFSKLESTKSRLRALNESVKIQFLDYSGLA